MNDNNKDDKTFIKQFDKCPGCGSTRRYYEGILNEVKERGLLDKKIECFDFQLHQGVALPEQKIDLLPFGLEIPAFKRIWDVCCNCGTQYDTVQVRTQAKKGIQLAQPAPLNRMQRREAERQGFQIPKTNDPRFS